MITATSKKTLTFYMLALAILFSVVAGCSSDGDFRPTVGPNIGIAEEKQIVSSIQQKHLCGEESRLIKSYENKHSRADVCNDKIVSYEKIEDKLENKKEHNLEDIVARLQILDSADGKFVISISFVSTESDWFFTTAEILGDGKAEMFEMSHGNLVVNLICGANRGATSKPCSSAF